MSFAGQTITATTEKKTTSSASVGRVSKLRAAKLKTRFSCTQIFCERIKNLLERHEKVETTNIE